MAWFVRTRERAQMNPTPPEASTEYSTGPGASGGGSSPRGAGGAGGVPGASRGGLGALHSSLILAGGLVGAVLLVAADLTRLYTVRGVATGRTVHSYGTGSHHGFALAVIGVACAVLAFGVWRVGSRPALLAIGVLGLVALLIALLGDLPDAHGTGLLVLHSGRYAQVAAQPGPGFYLETLGSVMLLITSVCGFLLVGPPPRTGAAASG